MVVGQEHRDEPTGRIGGLDLVLPALRCLRCDGRLTRDGGTLRCAGGHAFDVARQGYVHLAPGRTLKGDTAEMVQAREAFLDAGHYAPIAEALAAAANAITAPGVIADVGGGTGQHLGRVLDAAPGRTGIVLDSSTPALRRAARRHPRMAAAACDAWTALPLADDAAAVVLSVFAPRDAAEVRRVLHADGVLLAVTPTERHLHELRGPLGLLETRAGKADRLADELGLQERDRTLLEATLRLTADDARRAADMGPAGFHDRATTELPDRIEATLSVELTALGFAG